MNNQLIGFYRGTSPDIAGRLIQEVWNFDHSQLEAVHDYIQWLFPSAKASQFNPNAPILDAETIELFAADEDLKERLSKSFALMLDFYGLALATDAGATTVSKAPNYSDRKANWQDAPAGYLNHNLLRLTRILEALNVLGLKNESIALCACLAEIQIEESGKIPAKTLHFWRTAAASN